jgi:hypothetical protein
MDSGALIRPRLCSVLTALSLTSAPLAYAHAQATVAGVVTDSLAGAPLASATVQLVLANNPAGSIRSVMSDSSGRFHLDGVPTGVYLLGFTHQRLLNLGIDLTPRQIEVRSGMPAASYDLAIPGGRTLASALCGTGTDSSGVLAGRVLRADPGDAIDQGAVMVSWLELRIAGASIQRIPRGLSASADAAGRFVVCNVPSDVPVRVLATAGTAHSGEVELRVPPAAMLDRDLYVASSTTLDSSLRGVHEEHGSARLVGRVRGPNGQPITGGQVPLVGSGVSGVSDANGVFRLDSLPAGTRTVEARALGYVPAHSVLDLKSGVVSTANLTLDAYVATLEGVTVYGTAPDRSGANGFLERSRSTFGKFFTGAQVASSGITSLPELFYRVPGMQVKQSPRTSLSTVFARGSNFKSTSCAADVYLDGVYIVEGAMSLDNLVPTREIAGIEVYVDEMTVPSRFRRTSLCGAIVIWTKALMPGTR